MANAMSGTMESVEVVAPKMKGTVERKESQQGYGYILAENGESYRFNFSNCVGGADTFNTLDTGMVVTFTEHPNNAAKMSGTDLAAMNVVVEEEDNNSSGTFGNVEATKNAAAQIYSELAQHGNPEAVSTAISVATELVEAMGPKMKGTVERKESQQGYGYILAENGESYRFNFSNCVGGADTFNTLDTGMVVTFTEHPNNAAKMSGTDLTAVNVTVEEV